MAAALCEGASPRGLRARGANTRPSVRLSWCQQQLGFIPNLVFLTVERKATPAEAAPLSLQPGCALRAIPEGKRAEQP